MQTGGMTMRRITFVATTPLPASADAVFDWHEAPGAFERLTPPWERVRVVRHVGGIRDGAQVWLRVGPAPFSLRWDWSIGITGTAARSRTCRSRDHFDTGSTCTG